MFNISRFLTHTTIVAAALIAAGVAVSSAAHAAPEQEDPPRSELFVGVDACPGAAGGGAISVSYDDLVDGHTPQAVTEVLTDQSGELWRTTEVHQVDGDYFNVHNFPATAAIPITDDSVFTYTLTIAYEDGVTQTQSVALAIADHCDAGSPSTTAPPTTAPGVARFELGVGGVGTCWSSDWSIAFNYVDFVDGHLNTESHFQLVVGGRVIDDFGEQTAEPGFDGETAEWEVPGDLFSVDELEATTYTLVVWVKYEDGVVESHRASYDVVATCGRDPATTSPPSSSPTTTTTTPPSGTLPQTGGSMTVGIGAVGGLLSVTGAAMLASVRRRKSV